MSKSFTFVLSLINVEGDLPIEVIPQHLFQKANPDQIDTIKELLARLFPYPWLESPYEYTVQEIPQDTPGSFEYKYEVLPQQDWRYWVIAFEGYNTEIPELGFASALLKNDLELGFTVLSLDIIRDAPSGSQGYLWHLPSLFSYFLDDMFGKKPVVNINSADIGEIGTNYALIKSISAEHEHITRALERFDTLRSLPRSSELVIIGLFSIIESLITHSPKLSESSDSLSHQIKTKIPLLGKRFQRALDYELFFDPSSKESAIWSKLYDYRSKIVHGEHTDIDSKLQILRSRENIISFLREAVKLLLLLALKEPVLLTDLKKC